MQKRIHKQRIRRPISKERITPVVKTRRKLKAVPDFEHPSDRLPWYVARLENEGKTDRVQIHALRRQCKANGRLKMVKCWLVKDKGRDGEWVIRLEGGITGREYLRARKHCGDCFFILRLHGWTVHKGSLSEDPRHDYFWIPGREIADVLQDFGWL